LPVHQEKDISASKELHGIFINHMYYFLYNGQNPCRENLKNTKNICNNINEFNTASPCLKIITSLAYVNLVV